MIRRSTVRLPVAIGASLFGLLVAVLAGQPEAALLVSPWIVLATLGITSAIRPVVAADLFVLNDRVLVGDEVTLVSTVKAVGGGGLVLITPEADSTVWGSGTAEASNPGTALHLLDADHEIEVISTLTANEWGAHDVGLASIELWQPYGLFRSLGTISKPLKVRVHPTPAQLRQLLTPAMVRRVSGTHRSRESARGVEYADIRSFQPGDSLRDINWRASARSHDLWVSQRHPDRMTDVVLLLDSFVESGHDIRRVFGLAVEAAVALAESHLGAADRVGLIEFGGLVRWVSPGTGRVQLQRLTDALLSTGLYANAADRELPMLSTRALPPRSFVVAISPLLDDRFVAGLFSARERGHDVAVIECVAYNRAGDDAESEAREVAAAIWQAERAMLKDQLAQHSISVAQWREGDPLDLVLGELTRRRAGIRGRR